MKKNRYRSSASEKDGNALIYKYIHTFRRDHLQLSVGFGLHGIYDVCVMECDCFCAQQESINSLHTLHEQMIQIAGFVLPSPESATRLDVVLLQRIKNLQTPVCLWSATEWGGPAPDVGGTEARTSSSFVSVV
jgi:hypothetical protein